MNKKILHLAIPSIISNISIPLIGMVDLALVGHLENLQYIGAISLGGMIFNFIYWGFGFLRMGTTGITAQSYGSKNLKEAGLTLARSFLIGISGGFLLILLQKPIGILSFYLLNGSEEVEQLAKQYFYIRIWAAPATLGLYSLTGWFIGMQNTRFPMIITVSVNLLNVVFSVFFVLKLDMKSEGVALGTVLAQLTGLLIGLFLYFKYYKKLNKYIHFSSLFDKEAINKFFHVNKDIFIRTLFLIFTFTFFTAESARAGNDILAINTLLLQYFMFFSYLIDGFAYAAEALTGKYIGSGSLKELRINIRLLFKWGILTSIPFSLTYLAGGKAILSLLTNNQELIQMSLPYMFWVALVPVITFPAFLLDGIFIGATASKGMRNTMIISTVIFYLPVYYILKPQLGNHALWLALMTFMISRGLFMYLRMKKDVYEQIA
jgi:MATE family multidrug resistance protein